MIKTLLALAVILSAALAPAYAQSVQTAPGPHLVLRAKDNRTEVTVKKGTTLEFKLGDVIPNGVCRDGTARGGTVQNVGGDTFKATASGTSTIAFRCFPAAPKPGTMGSQIVIAYIISVVVR